MVKKELTKKDLSRSYSIATTRIHQLITEFYEELHDSKGEPKENPGVVANMISGIRIMINHELDLIKDASYEYFEDRLDDKSKQEEILFDNRKSRRGSL